MGGESVTTLPPWPLNLGPIPEEDIIATLDVTSLYTNIPNHEGMLAVADHMRKDPNKGPIGNYIQDLLKLVLHNMYLLFYSIMNSF